MKLQINNLRTVVEASDIESDWLFDYLAFDNPSARFYKRKVADTKTRLFNRITRSFPSGFVELVENAAPQSGFDVEVEDERQQPIARDKDADLSWLRDYQLRGVQIAAKKARGILWLPTGCLTGDTKLVINRGGCARTYELRTVVKRLAGESTQNRSGRWAKWDLAIPTYTQSVDDSGFVRKNRIRRGWSNGIADVFELVTENGRVIRATEGHRFWTPNGFVHLRDLRVGDQVTITTWSRTFAPKRKALYTQQPHMWNHPFRQISNSARDGRIARVPFHRLVAEARENELTITDFVGRIILNKIDGLIFLDPKVWHVHHIDGDSYNNSPENLEVLSEREHTARHGKTENWKHVSGRVIPEKIKSIRLIGEEEVFDLELEAPLNNYVANEFLVHNSGKTELAVGLATAFPCRWTFLVHRASLMQQAAERYERRTGAPAGRIGEGNEQIERFTVATFQTLFAKIKNASARTKDPKVAQLMNLVTNVEGLIVDECFPAGTLIDGRPIETIRVGDIVTSFDTQQNIVQKRVTRLWKRKTNTLARVVFSDGRVICCTPNHKFWTESGWVPAKELTCRENVLSLKYAHNSMHEMRYTSPTRHDSGKTASFLPHMPCHSSTRARQKSNCKLRNMCARVYPQRATRIRSRKTTANLLQYRMSQQSPLKIIDKNSLPRCSKTSRTHVTRQPDEKQRCQVQGKCNPSENWSPSPVAWRKRSRFNATTTNTARISFKCRVGVGGRIPNSNRKNVPITEQHLYRYSPPNTQNCDRDRWCYPLPTKSKRRRRTQRAVSSWIGVDSVSILESTSDGTFGGVCRDGFVYNIEVADTHTYFAEGVGVANCHVLPANSFYHTVMRMKKAYWRIGISGTPLARGDRRSLVAVGALGPVIYRVKPELLIARGLLARPDIRMLKIPTPSSKPTFQGVYGEGIVRNTPRNNMVVAAAKASAKPALIFVKEIKHGKAILDRLTRAGIAAEFVWGNTITPSRMNSVKRLTRGEIDVLICSVIFQEGVDIPELKSVIIATAGKSVIAAIQRVGRGMRMSANKGGKFEVWDFYDMGNRMLERHAKERMRAYEREGYTVKVSQEIP